jgi:pyroglutamyl-peptidase
LNAAAKRNLIGAETMNILVTAFGPFDGRAENASSLALDWLKSDMPEIHTRVLPVDSVIAPARLKQAIRKINPEILMMLGEAAGSRSIRLERYAWNSLDFRIPDIAGRQPMGKLIRKIAVDRMVSTLPIEKILRSLKSKGHQVERSDDPGRYLCNQVFFTAMDLMESECRPCLAGFVHLPLADKCPTPRAADAVKQIIAICAKDRRVI